MKDDTITLTTANLEMVEMLKGWAKADETRKEETPRIVMALEVDGVAPEIYTGFKETAIAEPLSALQAPGYAETVAFLIGLRIGRKQGALMGAENTEDYSA